MPIPEKKASVSLGIGAAPESAHRSSPKPSLGPLGGVFIGHRLAGEQGAAAFCGHGHRPLHCLPLGVVHLVADGEFDSSLELFPYSRDRAPHRGPHVGQRRRDGAPVGHDRDLGTEHLLAIQGGHSVGDVRRRQERSDPVTELDPEHGVEAVALEQQVSVGHLDTLGVSGGTGRVDKSDHIVGLHRAPGRLEVEVVGGGGVQVVYRDGAGRRTVDAHDVLDGRTAGADAVHILLLAHHDLGAGVVEQISQLLGGQRVVHRKRSGTDMLGAHLERIELDPVAHHQRNGVAPPNPQARQAGGHLPHLRRILPPRQCLGAAGCAERNGVRIDRRGALERLAQGGRTLGRRHFGSPWRRISTAHTSVSVRP